ncbi:hypothetical protein ACZ90_23800 [Streptomyces albus subsp. albus]|nr:hypothetical protein ACZ90_23800 [Streptomyces albus subsp. albus]
MRDRGRRGTGLAAVLALGVLLGAPGPTWAAPGSAAGSRDEPRAVPGAAPSGTAAYQPQGRRIRGTTGERGAPSMRADDSYVDSIGVGEKRYYRVRLDQRSTAYVSAVAVPRPGARISAYTDGVRLTLADAGGEVCGQSHPVAEAANVAYPLSGYASRLLRSGPAATCRQAGTYYFTVERTGAGTADRDRWPLELRFTQEPAVRGGPTTAPSPGGWSTRPPEPPTGAARQAAGGTGFRDAGPLSTGVWTTRIEPGETRFYRIPLDWGQQLYAETELPDASGAKQLGVLGDALGVSLYNPARGLVQHGRFAPYSGKRAKDALDLTAPVAYGNRYARAKAPVAAMSFSGQYYLAVTVHPDAARYFPGGVPVTLRVSVRGSERPGPDYDEDGTDAGFGLSGQDRRTAAENRAAAEEDGGRAGLRVVAYAGFGAGTALLAGLAVWTLAARRRGPADG